MKKWLKRLLLFGTAAVVLASSVGYIFRRELQNYFWEYVEWQTDRSIARYGTGLPTVDEVRLFRIADAPAKPNLGTHKVPFYLGSEMTKMTIVAEKTLTGDPAQNLASQWRQLRLDTDGMAGCYDPHHVIQFRSGGKVICEATMCFSCGNTSLPAFPIQTLVNFDHRSPAFLGFKKSVEAEVGIHEVDK